MEMRLGFLFLVLAALLLAVLSTGLLRWGAIDNRLDSGLALEQPSLVASAAAATGGQEQEQGGVNFLEQEAGISAYVKLDQPIDLEQVREAFKTIETVSDEYIIGEVALPDLPEKAHPHVYVNKDGWIVAYYSKDEPASKITQWIGYDGGTITTTTLEDAIRKIWDAFKAPFPFPQLVIKYYDFEYPNANRIMLITETTDKWWGGVDKFYLKIPAGCHLFEASWTLHHRGGWHGELWLDDTLIKRIDERGIKYGNLGLKEEFRHTIKVYNHKGFTGAAIVLIYRA